MRLPRRLTLSLRHLLIVLTAMGLLPLAVLGVWSIHAAAGHHRAEQERALLDQAHALSSAVDAELDGSIATLSSMTRTPMLAEGNVRGFYDIARDQAQVQGNWIGVVLSDSDGKQLFRTMAPFGAPPSLVADPESLHAALSVRHPVVGHISRGPGGRIAVPVRVPFADHNGRLYVLSAIIRPDRIVRVITRQRLPQDTVIAILDGKGELVARSRGQDLTVAGPVNPALRELMRTGGPENVVRREVDGADLLTGYTTLSRYGWTVAVTASQRSVFAQGFTAYGAGVALSLALCIVLASFLSARILRTLAGLQSAATALGAGQPVTVARSRLQEVRELGRALQRAARQRDDHERERSLLLASLKDALAQARAADQAKDAFLAVLGHELRNPLAPIVASLDLMDMRDESGARRERTIMRRQVNHLRRLVDDLLDISRIASGKLRIEQQAVDLAELARLTVSALPGRPVTVQAPDHVWVHGDESRLAQVLNNLLSNATRFGSTATRVALDAAGGVARLSVTDNGEGMAPDTLARVFDMFYQAPQPLARHTGGLGLGLAIVRKIVELHGGRIAAHSDGPGLGSRFEVELPLGEPAAPDTVLERQAGPGGLRVLLVDDNVDAANSVAALLAGLGHDARVAHTAAEGLALAASAPPDVAVLDIGLPDMDGYALAAALRARLPGIWLVALTGYGQKSDVERAAQAGFDLHLTKPATLEDLRGALAGAGMVVG